MAIPIHVVYVRLVAVDPLGRVVDKNNLSTTINSTLRTEHQHRVQPSRAGMEPVVPNAADEPTVPVFLAREAADGYRLQYQDQRMLVLYGGE